MLLLFVVGVMNLLWVALITILVLVENGKVELPVSREPRAACPRRVWTSGWSLTVDRSGYLHG